VWAGEGFGSNHTLAALIPPPQRGTFLIHASVIPAKAGAHLPHSQALQRQEMDSRLRGNDGCVLMA
jgi:hypothetical protein